MENTSFTISVNILFMGDVYLVKLLDEEMNRRGLTSLRKFSHVIGISHPTLGSIMAGERASIETYEKLSPILHLSLETIMRAAGVFGETLEARKEQEKIIAEILSKQTPEDLDELKELGLLKIRRREDAQENKDRK